MNKSSVCVAKLYNLLLGIEVTLFFERLLCNCRATPQFSTVYLTLLASLNAVCKVVWHWGGHLAGFLRRSANFYAAVTQTQADFCDSQAEPITDVGYKHRSARTRMIFTFSETLRCNGFSWPDSAITGKLGTTFTLTNCVLLFVQHSFSSISQCQSEF